MNAFPFQVPSLSLLVLVLESGCLFVISKQFVTTAFAATVLVRPIAVVATELIEQALALVWFQLIWFLLFTPLRVVILVMVVHRRCQQHI